MHGHVCTSRKRTRGLFTVGKVTEVTFTKMSSLVCIYATEFYTKNAQKRTVQEHRSVFKHDGEYVKHDRRSPVHHVKFKREQRGTQYTK